MPADAYITVTLKKETVKKLTGVAPAQPTSKTVTEAINEYVNSRKDAIPSKMTVPITDIFELSQSETLEY